MQIRPKLSGINANRPVRETTAAEGRNIRPEEESTAIICETRDGDEFEDEEGQERAEEFDGELTYPEKTIAALERARVRKNLENVDDLLPIFDR